jgi:OOP family OmpA-OmpF porin
MRKNRIGLSVVLIALALAALVLSACASGGSSTTTPATGGGSAPAPAASGGGATVTEANLAFSPTSVTVKVGDTVTFENKDSAPHDVKIDGQDLGNQAPGATVTWKATKAGTFPFSCTIHPSMTGQVVVE